MSETHKGGCLCGAVRFTVTGAIPRGDACHCRECRRWSGHFWASSDVPRERLTLERAETLRWYRRSPAVRRGFCADCGSALFFEREGASWLGVALGAFEGATGTDLHAHIFAAEQGDYYQIPPGDYVIAARIPTAPAPTAEGVIDRS